ncbi:type II toxin-antitoxin system HipA family toxin [Ferrovum sp. PN-J185]|nr:type II toxin-antitoxin system HipA family toxin [Ferrovum sp. PN-J185]
MRALSVWMNGEQVGLWTQGRGNTHKFSYEASWLSSPHCRSLSLSLPISANLTISGSVVENYFDNLLPDNERIRKRIAQIHKTKSQDAFDLLEQIGRDCVGAVQLLPPNEAPIAWNKLQFDTLDTVQIAQLLRDTPNSQGSLDTDRSDYRISLAGAQEKTALLKLGDQWCKPKGATPTSHIFKLPMGMVGGQNLNWQYSVENEWLCLNILEALGLPVTHADIGQFEDQKALIVERFDRQWIDSPSSPAWLARLPQEDFCQIFGLPPSLKYESDGGPGIDSCIKVLSNSQNAVIDMQIFLLAQLAFWLLGAIDGHAKNFSIRIKSRDQYELTPLYDVLSVWPVIGKRADQIPPQRAKMAMAIRGRNTHYLLNEIQTRHWQALAKKHGGEPTWNLFLSLVHHTEEAIAQVKEQLPPSFPTHVATTIFKGMLNQKDKFLKGL